MKDIHGSISRATDLANTPAERREAFGELVVRFQDMAFACAYAVLGDAFLAEDVAQEAFVVTWQKLDQLREPKAFPGWFKRIVLTQCNRLTRGIRLQIVPLEFAESSPTTDAGPHVVAEKQDLLTKVLTLIKSLPEDQRLATTLFYVNGYTQADIGAFLEVPVSTVNKRLYTARQRLKEGMVGEFKDNLHRRRPSRDKSFSERVNAKLRPLVSEDWFPVKTMAFAREHRDVPGNDLWLHRRQTFNEARYFRRQYVVEDAGSAQILGFGSIEQSVYLPKYRLFLITDSHWIRRGVGDLLLERLTKDLQEAKAVSVSCRDYASQTELLAFLKERGFSEASTVLESRLSLPEVDLSHLSTVVEKVKKQGIVITTFAEERIRDPRCVEKLYELTVTLEKDDPARSPFAAPAYNAAEALMWLQRPYVIPEAYFIAKHGNSYVGISDISLFEAVPGGLTQGFTGVLRAYRRRGVATALKVHAVDYARRHDYRIIQSFNDPKQTEALALNEKLGFKPLFTYVTLEKCLREIVDVPSHIYDEYAGRYQSNELHQDPNMIVRNEEGRLTVELIGQKVELFPASEKSFFVKQFYGEVTFFRNDEGKVMRLEFTMPDHKSGKPKVFNAPRVF